METVGAFACSHAGLLITRKAEAPTHQRQRVYDAFRQMGQAIKGMAPDAIIMLATDHGRIHKLDAVPQFMIGVSAVAEGFGDVGLPRRDYPINQPVARALLAGLMEAGIDLAYSEAMKIDHSFVSPLILAFGDEAPTLVPIMQNCNLPPTPSPARCLQVGRALRQAIDAAGAGRVVIVATGGLSHWVGSDAYRQFIYGAPGNRLNDPHRPALDLPDRGPVAEDFDAEFLSHVCEGRAREFVAAWSSPEIVRRAGNGAEEIRNWIVACAAVGHAKAKVLAYEPVQEWLTGTAIVQFDLPRR